MEEIKLRASELTPRELIKQYKHQVENVDGGDGDWCITMLINNSLVFIKYLNNTLIRCVSK